MGVVGAPGDAPAEGRPDVPLIAPGRHPGRRLISWRIERFLREPPTVRRAAGVIVTITTIVVVLSAVVMWIFDHEEFKTLGVSLWWAVQTASTVGYGDVTPHKTVGRLIATVVMLEGIAFLAVITAAITSTFVTRAQEELGAAGKADRAATLADIDRRLERIEALLARDHPDRTMPPGGVDASIEVSKEGESQ